MSEVNAFSNEELISKTRDQEAEIRKLKAAITRSNNEIKDLDLRVKENKDRLALST
jgi:peptidoglycan hydrolase CwlO-like protein